MTDGAPHDTDALIEALVAREDTDDTFDIYVELERLRPELTPDAWVKVAEAFEVCFLHNCDEEICADDQADCPAGRGER